MTTKLPASWQWVEIGEVAKVVGGGTPPAADPANFAAPGTGTPWLTPADLSGYRGQYVSRGARDLSQAGFAACSARLLPKGAVLFSSRAPVGYVAIAAVDVTTNQGFKSFVFGPSVEPRFAYYQLRHLKPVAEAMATGTTFKELSGGVAAKLPFVVAPAGAQQRIADKLDTVLARVDACRDRLARIAPLLKRFRQSVLAAATSGRLSMEWRQKHCSVASSTRTQQSDLPAGWQRIPLKNLVINMDSRRVPIKAADRAARRGPYPYYGAFGVIDSIDDYIFDGRFLLLAEDGKNLEKRDRPIALIANGKFWVNNHAHVLQSKPETSLEYLCAWLNSERCDLTDLLTGIDQIKLTRGAMDRIAIPVPSTAEQDEIVRRVETLFAFADRLEARLAQAQTAVDRLTPSMLAKAFRGELVPQDPADEPAAELLKRLRASPATPPAAAPRRGRPLAGA